MKNFSRFISEAQDSVASQRAQKMGLKGDGHGGWYNSAGEFIAKTEGGKLKFYTKGQKPGRDTPDSPKKKAKPEEPTQEPQAQEGGQSVTVVFGKFNPPTRAHQQLFTAAQGVAAGGDLKIYPSRAKDSEMNPLNPESKIGFMKSMFPRFADNIVNSNEMVTIFDVLQSLENDGYTEVTIVVGSDRLGEFRSLAKKHNGDLYNFNEIDVVAGGKLDSDQGSSSEMRQMAMNDDLEGFQKMLPKGFKDGEKLFKKVQDALGSGTKKEELELWRVSPKLDYGNLREQYVNNNIFKKGTIVENLNTGLKGNIIRRGTNYLICTTEDNVMFKSWITDIREVAAFTDQSGVPADQREVGTDALRKYAMKMSGTDMIKNFINKYKKKK